jgi:hypothetical protein
MGFTFIQVYLASLRMNKAFKPNSREFRNWGSENPRIEALSDAVFAFSVSLLTARSGLPVESGYMDAPRKEIQKDPYGNAITISGYA